MSGFSGGKFIYRHSILCASQQCRKICHPSTLISTVGPMIKASSKIAFLARILPHCFSRCNQQSIRVRRCFPTARGMLHTMDAQAGECHTCHWTDIPVSGLSAPKELIFRVHRPRFRRYLVCCQRFVVRMDWAYGWSLRCVPRQCGLFGSTLTGAQIVKG